MAPAPNHTLDLPAGSAVRTVMADITAAGLQRLVKIGEVATVGSEPTPPFLPPESTILIVDFGVPAEVTWLSLAGWTQIDASPDGEVWNLAIAQADGVQEPPFRTKATKLRIFVKRTVAPAAAATSGVVSLALPVADLELSVNGVRAWSQPGYAPANSPAGFELKGISLTRAFQDQLDAGSRRFDVRLKSRTSARLTAVLTGRYRRVHGVTFPEGPARSIDAAAEGDLVVELPLPADAAKAQINGIRATLAVRSGPERALPATGPGLTGKATLIVDSDRAVTVRLPESTTDRLAEIAGVRLPVFAGPEGAELRGVLRTDVAGEPGPPIPRLELGPVTLEPDARAFRERLMSVQMVSLMLPKPRKLAPGAMWLEIVATRGRVEWPLADGPSLRWPLAVATRVEVRRPQAGGGYRRLSEVPGVDANCAAVRVIGTPRANAPIFPADVGIVFREGFGDPVITVAASGPVAAVEAELGADSDLSAYVPSVGAYPRISLRLTAAAAGTLTLSDVTVAYGETDLPVS